MLWVSGELAWLQNASGGLPQDPKAARASEVRRWRVLGSWATTTMQTAMAVAETANGSMLDARLGRPQHARAPCASAAREATSEAFSALGTHLSALSSVRQLTS